jgi:hypothetical protein
MQASHPVSPSRLGTSRTLLRYIGDDTLQTHANDALTVLPWEPFGEANISLAFPDSTHQHTDASAMLLESSNEAEPTSATSLADMESSNTDDGNCRCMTDALIILDKLETKTSESSLGVTHTVSGTLSFNKTALLQCNKVIECPTCQYRPGCALLLILICRNLVFQFHQVLSSDLNPVSRQSSPIKSLDGDTAALGQYSIDTSEEQLQVLWALAIVQGRSLALFVDNLKSLVCLQPGAVSHQEKIESVENWHRNLMDRLKQMSYGKT